MSGEIEIPEECECCGFEMRELRNYPVGKNGSPFATEPRWLCDLCAGTFTSNAAQYPEQFHGQLETMRTICYVGNAILEQLKAMQVPRSEP